MKILIKVTKEVLRKTMHCGEFSCQIAENCAITYACREIFPFCKTEYHFMVPFWTNYGHLPDLQVIRIAIPDSATEFIGRFDESSARDRLLLPEFSFEIEVPDSVIDKIGIEEAKAIIEKSSTLELVG